MKTRPRYAEGTEVPVEKSRAEIEGLLIKHGATGFLSGWQGSKAFVQFMLRGRMLRYAVERPDPATFKSLRPEQRERHADAEHRRRWRALLLILKAKLEIVASGDSTFDREFLADIMLPQGGTVGEQLIPQLEAAYQTGEMPKLLAAGG